MPFNGGVVEITAGLLAMQGANYLNRFIKVMGDFASILIIPQLSAALNVAEPISKGVEELLGVRRVIIQQSLHQAFVGKEGGGSNNLKAGYIAAILAQSSELDAKKLWVVNDMLCYGTSVNNNKPLTGFTYMLFRIESREQRDDMDGLTNISVPFNEAISALLNGESERAHTLLRVAIVAAMTSPDLTRVDRRRVVQALKDEFDEVQNTKTSTRGKAIAAGEVPDLNTVMKRAMPVEEALALGEPTFEEIFGRENVQ